MSMSDCPKCWDTPCTCGYEYRNASDEYVITMYKLFRRLLDERDISLSTIDDNVEEVQTQSMGSIANKPIEKKRLDNTKEVTDRVIEKRIISKEEYDQIKQLLM